MGRLHPSDEGHVVAVLNESRIAFGRFVNHNRRRLKLSLEAIAKTADIEIVELMNIEHDANYEPKPRTIYQLATVFRVDQEKLRELSGLAKPKGTCHIEDAVRYAARSESPEDS
ncbi:MAG: helix-turn-helix transcriptional regulator [Aestuariivita sp.]|nr:helix-turn-helix transcriptional regulator [Aestuariivita sp.]MCY4201838.1 helix-turn-helix transcriptional regulator [Aestuariivita sp.]